MKLYRITAANGTTAEVEHVIWAGSQADAAKARKELGGHGYKRADIETEDVEVPTKKEELIAFLNDRRA